MPQDFQPQMCIRDRVKGIKFNLEHEGYQVQDAYDGEEAVELAREGGFDLIILDVMMPKIDGLQACTVSYTHLTKSILITKRD